MAEYSIKSIFPGIQVPQTMQTIYLYPAYALHYGNDANDNPILIFAPTENKTEHLKKYLEAIVDGDEKGKLWSLKMGKDKGISIIKILEDEHGECFWCTTPLDYDAPHTCPCTIRKLFTHRTGSTVYPPQRRVMDRTLTPRYFKTDGIVQEELLLVEMCRPDGNARWITLPGMYLGFLETNSSKVMTILRWNKSRPIIPRIPPLFTMYNSSGSIFMPNEKFIVFITGCDEESLVNERYYRGNNIIRSKNKLEYVYDNMLKNCKYSDSQMNEPYSLQSQCLMKVLVVLFAFTGLGLEVKKRLSTTYDMIKMYFHFIPTVLDDLMSYISHNTYLYAYLISSCEYVDMYELEIDFLTKLREKFKASSAPM